VSREDRIVGGDLGSELSEGVGFEEVDLLGELGVGSFERTQGIVHGVRDVAEQAALGHQHPEERGRRHLDGLGHGTQPLGGD
jgi:hypothetical protein